MNYSKVKNQLAAYNMLVNLFWTALFTAPVVVFCYRLLPHYLLYIFLIVSVLPFLLPVTWLRKLQFSSSYQFYRITGLKPIMRFTQNGDMINGIIRKTYPEYKAVSTHKKSVKNLIAQTYINEKFHWGMFVFYLAIAIYAISISSWLWAALICLCNMLYNLYPIILQQYIRLKLKIFLNKTS